MALEVIEAAVSASAMDVSCKVVKSCVESAWIGIENAPLNKEIISKDVMVVKLMTLNRSKGTSLLKLRRLVII
jgi:hypothetical protein